MSINQVSLYDFDQHVSEIYDRIESGTDDLIQIRNLIGQQIELRILEPFCGTGRLLIPLAEDGYHVHGLDQSQAMLDLASKKIKRLPGNIQARIILCKSDVVEEAWPVGFDLVILGCNCFYELASPREQQGCIRSAYRSLKPNGHLYIDSDHMEGDLAEAWRKMEKVISPLSGICEDGTRVENWMETIWFDAPERLVKMRRTVRITSPSGQVSENEYLQQKHPVSSEEVKVWLEEAGFSIIKHMGDREGHPYTPETQRSIFWARRE